MPTSIASSPSSPLSSPPSALSSPAPSTQAAPIPTRAPTSSKQKRKRKRTPLPDVSSYIDRAFGQIDVCLPKGCPSLADDGIQQENRGFAWCFWQTKGRKTVKIMVYKIEQRATHVLVQPCTFGNEFNFPNEIRFDTLKPCWLVDANSLYPANVWEWSKLHQNHNHVGDRYFCHAPSKQAKANCGAPACEFGQIITSNDSYLVCSSRACDSQAFHSACLSLQAPRRSECNFVEADNLPAVCPSCKSQFPFRIPNLFEQDPTSSRHSAPFLRKALTILIDLGSFSVKALAQADGEPDRYLSNTHSRATLRPICTISNDEVFWDYRIGTGEDCIEIKPFKKVFMQDGDTEKKLQDVKHDAGNLLGRFCADVINHLFEPAWFTDHSLNDIDITLGVACPAGMNHEKKKELLDGMAGSAPHVTPVLLNEGKLAFLGAKKATVEQWDIEEDCDVMAVDVGGYTTDFLRARFTPRGNQLHTTHLCSVMCGDEWVKDYLLDMLPDTIGKTRTEVRPWIEQIYADRYNNRPGVFTVCGFDIEEHVMRARSLQLEVCKSYLKELKQTDDKVDVLYITGGGTLDNDFRKMFEEVGGSMMARHEPPKIIFPSRPETSTVLQGALEFMNCAHEGGNKSTTLLKTNDCEEYIVLQYKGEAIQDPIVPPSRSIGTIMYEIEDAPQGELVYELFATSEDLVLNVSNNHYQVAIFEDEKVFLLEGKLWAVGDVKIDVPLLPEKHPYLVSAINIQIQQHFEHARVEGVLLAPKERANPKDQDFRQWGISESMTINAIRALAGMEDSTFSVVHSLKPQWFSLDMDNVKSRTITPQVRQ